jgi:hypothetical protein
MNHQQNPRLKYCVLEILKMSSDCLATIHLPCNMHDRKPSILRQNYRLNHQQPHTSQYRHHEDFN